MTPEEEAAVMVQIRAEIAANAAHMKATVKRGDWVTWSDSVHLVLEVHDGYVTLARANNDDLIPYPLGVAIGHFGWEVVEPLGDIELDAADLEMRRLLIGEGDE